MQNDPAPLPTIEVSFTPEFKRNLRQLAKTYRHIKTDIQPFLDALTQGETPGDQIPGVQFTVLKVRVKNSDSRKGKSGGYRIIYQQVNMRRIILITVYSKTEQADIEPHEIRQIILDYEALARQQEEGVPAPTQPEEMSGLNDTTDNDKDRTT